MILCTGMMGPVDAVAQQNSAKDKWYVSALPLSSVLDSIEKRKGVSFSYDYDWAKSILISREISFSKETDQLCINLFEGLPLEYEWTGQHDLRLIPVAEESLPGEVAIQVIDAVSGEPVPYVAVAFDDAGGTEADSLGIFDLPATGIRQISLYHIGYVKAELPAKQARKVRQVRLQPSEKNLDDVIVLEDEPGVQTRDASGATVINQSRISQHNTSVFTADPMRTIQLLPGISAQNDLSSEVRIRGGDADESLIVLDGMTLYEARHYYGIFSTINAGIVDRISVYKNNTPVNMEGRTSGVVDISTYNFSEGEDAFLNAELGLMNASASTVFTPVKGVQLMAAGRFTTGNPGQSRFQSLLNPRPAQRVIERDFSTFNVVSQVPNYAFQDWNGKLTWEVNDKLTIYGTTFHSHDETALQFDRTLNVQVVNTKVPLFREEYDEQGSWNNHAYQLGGAYRFKPHVQWANRVVLSKTDSESMLESAFWRRVNKDSTFTGRYSNMISNAISDLHVFSTLTVDDRKGGAFTGGVDLQYIDNTFRIDYGDRRQFDQEQEARTISLFASRKWYPWDKTGFDFGLRLSHYDQTGKAYLSPQLLITRELSEGRSLKASYSSPAQFMQRAFYEDLTGRAYTFWINANGVQVPVSRAHKWMVGFNTIFRHFKLDVELFYKKTNGIIEIASNQIGFDPRTSGINANTQLRVFRGNGRSFGLDLLGVLEAGNLTSQLSYTLGKTDQQFAAILNNQWIPARDDSRHQLKFSHVYKLKNWSFQALWVFSSGRPYTDISKLTGNIRDRMETDPSVFQTRLKDYHRIDIGVSYTFDFPSFNVYLDAGVLNVLNRRNVKYAQYIFGVRGTGGQSTNTIAGTEWGLLDRTFNFAAGIRF